MPTSIERSHGDFLSTGDAAQLLGSSRQHVVDLCTRGELPFIWVGRHRRIERSAVDRLLDDAPAALTRDQERSLWLHRAVVGTLAARPETVMQQARDNTTRLIQQHGAGMTTHWLRVWARALERGVDAVADLLTSRSPTAVELRQNSPFAGVITQETRVQVLDAFSRHWRDVHRDGARSSTAATAPDDDAVRTRNG